MSLLSEYTKKEQLLKQLSEELKALEGDQRLKNELEFKSKLEELMTEYGKKARDVIDLLSPNDSLSASQSSATSGRRKRKLRPAEGTCRRRPAHARARYDRPACARGMTAQVNASVYRPPTIASWVSEMLPLSFDLAVNIGKFRRLMEDRFEERQSKKDIIDFINNHIFFIRRCFTH